MFKKQMAVLVIELGAPTLLRTEQNVRTTFADQIANLGEVEDCRTRVLEIHCSDFVDNNPYENFGYV
jgi:hypothetical protein